MSDGTGLDDGAEVHAYRDLAHQPRVLLGPLVAGRVADLEVTLVAAPRAEQQRSLERQSTVSIAIIVRST